MNANLCPHCKGMPHYENQNSDDIKAGDYLFTNGTPSYGAYCICSGEIEIIYKNEDGFFDKEIRRAGEMVGMDNLNIHYFTCDAFATIDSKVCFFDKNFFVMNMLEVL